MGENAFLVSLSLEDLFLTEGPCSNDYFVSRKIERMLTTGMPKHGAGEEAGEDGDEEMGQGAGGAKRGKIEYLFNPEDQGAEDSAMEAEGSGGGELVPTIDDNWYVEKQKNCILALVGYCAQNPAVRVSGNVALSPLSIIGCMAMACRGAVNCQDLEQYCWPFICESAYAKAISIKQAVEAVGDYVTSMPKSCKTVNILMCDHAIQADFEADMDKNFKAKKYSLEEWEAVNELVTETTQIPKKVLSRKPTATTLIQAIFFQDQWAMSFPPKNTQKYKFKNEKGEQSQVMMMNQMETFECIYTGALQAVRLNYETKGVYAWFVMGEQASYADKALESFLKMFLHGFGKFLNKKTIKVSIPRFKAVMNIDLKQAFMNTEPNITSIFETGHLGNMSQDEDERFSTFEHMCYVEVNEIGTKAGAASVMGATRGGPPSFTFDKTFWMLIASDKKILFVAKVDNPEGGVDAGHNVQLTPQVTVPEPPASEDVDASTSKDFHVVTVENQIGIRVTLYGSVKDFKSDTKGSKVEPGTKTSNDTEPDTKTSNETEPDTITSNETKPDTITSNETTPTFSKLKYYVGVGQFIKVHLKNLSETTFNFKLTYVSSDGDHDPEDSEISLKKGKEYEFPYPLHKVAGEEEDFWHVLNSDGETILSLGFLLKK